MAATERFHGNALGDFYTDGQCLQCGTPEHEAPDLLAPLTDENNVTYFVRQPEKSEEIERACRAAAVCCVDSLRYSGHDPEIIRRLGNRAQYCDHVLPGGPVRMPEENDHSWNAVSVRFKRDGQP
jgi:hypothetical protein